jgi:hypothetical protein
MQLLQQAWELWKRFGLFMGNLFGRVILTLFYFTVYLPFGLGVRLFGDPLKIKGARPTWQERTTAGDDLDQARRLA